MDYALPIGLTLLAILVVGALYVLVAAGSPSRFLAAQRVARRWLGDPAFASKVDVLLAEASKPAEKPRPSGEPLRLLTLLQREGRLLDFLLEDVQAYTNDQIGAAVRDIQRNCQKALKDHLTLAPVLDAQEGAAVDVPVDFDPSAIRLTGNVTGKPPFRGALQHHGWRVLEIRLAKPPQGQDEFVVQPAEVELA